MYTKNHSQQLQVLINEFNAITFESSEENSILVDLAKDKKSRAIDRIYYNLITLLSPIYLQWTKPQRRLQLKTNRNNYKHKW